MSFAKVEKMVDGEDQYTDWITPNSEGYLNVSVFGVCDSKVSLQRYVEGPNCIPVRTVRLYRGSVETSIVDKGTGVQYRLGIQEGRRHFGKSQNFPIILILWR